MNEVCEGLLYNNTSVTIATSSVQMAAILNEKLIPEYSELVFPPQYVARYEDPGQIIALFGS